MNNNDTNSIMIEKIKNMKNKILTDMRATRDNVNHYKNIKKTVRHENNYLT